MQSQRRLFSDGLDVAATHLLLAILLSRMVALVVVGTLFEKDLVDICK